MVKSNLLHFLPVLLKNQSMIMISLRTIYFLIAVRLVSVQSRVFFYEINKFLAENQLTLPDSYAKETLLSTCQKTWWTTNGWLPDRPTLLITAAWHDKKWAAAKFLAENLDFPPLSCVCYLNCWSSNILCKIAHDDTVLLIAI